MISVRRFPLRIAIQSIFLSIFIILVSVIVTLSSFEYSKSIEVFSKKLMADAATNVMGQLRNQLLPAELAIKLTKSLMEKDLITPQQLVDYTYVVAKNLPHYTYKTPIRVSTWGDDEGNSIATTLEADGTYSTDIITPNTTPPVSTKLYRDLDGKIIKREPITHRYDPRTRPWYIAAKKAAHPIWTKIYTSLPYKNLTVATANPIYNKQKKLLGIFELELKMIGFAKFLSSVKISANSHVLILNTTNELIAYEGMKAEFVNKSESEKIKTLELSGDGGLVTAVVLFNKTHQEYFRYRLNGHTYLAYFKPIPKIGYSGLKIGIIVLERDFTDTLKKANTLMQRVACF